MKITVLASDHPRSLHGNANELVLFSLIQGLVQEKHSVSWAYLGSREFDDSEIGDAEAELGATFSKELSGTFEPETNRLLNWRVIRWIYNLLFLGEPVDKVPESTADLIRSTLSNHKSDLFILFWDSWYEYALDIETAKRSLGFLAKPRYDASEVRVKTARGLQALLKKIYMKPIFDRMRVNYYSRISKLSHCSNICALTARQGCDEGVQTSYVPLLLKDFFSNNANVCLRNQSETAQIVIGFGNYEGLGTQIGIEYIISEVLPRLSKSKLNKDYKLNVFGKGLPAKTAQRLSRFPKVKIRGFVSDIDKEFSQSHAYLFCNNAGSYQGTYTRVSYALSSGICIIGHSNLALSVPELCSGQNCLLGNDPDEITAHLISVIENPNGQSEIHASARDVYLNSFSPRLVARKLLLNSALRSALT